MYIPSRVRRATVRRRERNARWSGHRLAAERDLRGAASDRSGGGDGCRVMRHGPAIAAVLVALWLAGCGGSDPGAGPTPTSPTPPMSAQPPAAPPPPPAPTATALEDQVLALVNERRAAGATCGDVTRPAVGPLAMDSRLRNAARLHSEDMAARAYFSHTSPDGRDPGDRMRAAGYPPASTWGENIARGQPTAQVVVDAWMASPDHCVNIMSGLFRVTGVGYASSGPHWTQVFAGG